MLYPCCFEHYGGSPCKSVFPVSFGLESCSCTLKAVRSCLCWAALFLQARNRIPARPPYFWETPVGRDVCRPCIAQGCYQLSRVNLSTGRHISIQATAAMHTDWYDNSMPEALMDGKQCFRSLLSTKFVTFSIPCSARTSQIARWEKLG